MDKNKVSESEICTGCKKSITEKTSEMYFGLCGNCYSKMFEATEGY